MSSDSMIDSPYLILFKQWLSGGLANAITSGILNPMDVAKTRLQSVDIGNISKPKTTMTMVLIDLYRQDGFVGCWKPGLAASAIREMINSGARAGFYPLVRDSINATFKSANSDDLLPKILAAMITGTAGSILANPIDVIKIRLMANPSLYPSTLKGFPIIIKAEGIKGLYKGLVPSTLRGAFIAAGELATYDHAKFLLRKQLGFPEGSVLHICSSLITGLVATTVAAPFDMIKTRAMNQTNTTAFGFFKLFKSIILREGALALFRGWLPAYLRLGPHAIICFPIYEQLRIFLGLGYL